MPRKSNKIPKELSNLLIGERLRHHAKGKTFDKTIDTCLHSGDLLNIIIQRAFKSEDEERRLKALSLIIWVGEILLQHVRAWDKENIYHSGFEKAIREAFDYHTEGVERALKYVRLDTDSIGQGYVYWSELAGSVLDSAQRQVSQPPPRHLAGCEEEWDGYGWYDRPVYEGTEHWSVSLNYYEKELEKIEAEVCVALRAFIRTGELPEKVGRVAENGG